MLRLPRQERYLKHSCLFGQIKSQALYPSPELCYYYFRFRYIKCLINESKVIALVTRIPIRYAWFNEALDRSKYCSKNDCLNNFGRWPFTHIICWRVFCCVVQSAPCTQRVKTIDSVTRGRPVDKKGWKMEPNIIFSSFQYFSVKTPHLDLHIPNRLNRMKKGWKFRKNECSLRICPLRDKL